MKYIKTQFVKISVLLVLLGMAYSTSHALNPDEDDRFLIQKAPMSGEIIGIFVIEGQNVKKGTLLFTMEAMKEDAMVYSPIQGKVMHIFHQVGASVTGGAKFLSILPSPADPLP